MNSAANRTELHFDTPVVIRPDATKKVEVVGPDKHRFYVTMQDAAESCAKGVDLALWREQFQEFLADLGCWCSQNATSVARCYVTWGEGHLKVFVTVTGNEYRFDLDDILTDLELTLTRIYPDHYASVLQIPEAPAGELASFFSPGKAIQVYGQSIAAPKESRTQSDLSCGDQRT
jgi:hypothetical protein